MTKADLIIKKLDEFVNREIDSPRNSISFYVKDKNSYEIYNIYTITKNNGMFEVSKKHTFLEKKFTTLQTAVAYCIMDRRNKIHECKKLEELDFNITQLNSSITLHTTLIKKNPKHESYLIYHSKLTDEKLKKSALVKELQAIVNEAKNWQNRQFLKMPNL